MRRLQFAQIRVGYPGIESSPFQSCQPKKHLTLRRIRLTTRCTATAGALVRSESVFISIPFFALHHCRHRLWVSLVVGWNDFDAHSIQAKLAPCLAARSVNFERIAWCSVVSRRDGSTIRPANHASQRTPLHALGLLGNAFYAWSFHCAGSLDLSFQEAAYLLAKRRHRVSFWLATLIGYVERIRQVLQCVE